MFSACDSAGRQVVADGKVDMEFMQIVTDPGVTQKKFQEQADIFWESLDGKAAFYKEWSKLEYDMDSKTTKVS